MHVSTPEDGLKVNLVDVTFCGKLPVFAVTHVRYILALVVVSSVIPVLVALVAFVAVPTVMVDGLVYCGAEAPAVKMCVDVPKARNVVAPAPVLYDNAPAVPPAKLVAVPTDKDA